MHPKRMVRGTEEASQFRQQAPYPAFTGQTVLIQGTPAAAAGLQADSQPGEDLLGREQ